MKTYCQPWFWTISMDSKWRGGEVIEWRHIRSMKKIEISFIILCNNSFFVVCGYLCYKLKEIILIFLKFSWYKLKEGLLVPNCCNLSELVNKKMCCTLNFLWTWSLQFPMESSGMRDWFFSFFWFNFGCVFIFYWLWKRIL